MVEHKNYNNEGTNVSYSIKTRIFDGESFDYIR